MNQTPTASAAGAGSPPPPAYYTQKSLAAAAGVSRSTFVRHESENVGRLREIREKIPGLGVVYPAAKARRYLDLCAAVGRKPKAPEQSLPA